MRRNSLLRKGSPATTLLQRRQLKASLHVPHFKGTRATRRPRSLNCHSSVGHSIFEAVHLDGGSRQPPPEVKRDGTALQGARSPHHSARIRSWITTDCRHGTLPQARAETVQKDGLQPGVETASGVVLELGKLSPEDQEHILDQICAVGLLLIQFSGPMKQQWGVQINEPFPDGHLVGMPQPIQQAGGSDEHHTSSTFRSTEPVRRQDDMRVNCLERSEPSRFEVTCAPD